MKYDSFRFGIGALIVGCVSAFLDSVCYLFFLYQNASLTELYSLQLFIDYHSELPGMLLASITVGAFIQGYLATRFNK